MKKPTVPLIPNGAIKANREKLTSSSACPTFPDHYVDSPEALALLDAPLASLPLPRRALTAFSNYGYHTLGELVSHDPGHVISGLWQSDLSLTKTFLTRLGLSFVGTQIPRP